MTALIVFPALVEAASFDCAKASSKVEKLICGDTELSGLDADLAARYERALKTSPFSAALRLQQRQWLRDIRNRCSNVACLRVAYNLRTKDFEWVTKQGQNNALCEEFRRQQNQRNGLFPYALKEDETGQDGPNFSIPNIDVDEDKVSDKVLVLRTNSGSIVPADNSSFSVVLSSTGGTFTVEAARLYAIGYKSKYYLLTAEWLGEVGPVRSDIYRLDRRGIKKLCSYECGLPHGSCGDR